MIDLDTQLRNYADYLDHVLAEPGGEVIALDAARAPRLRWTSAAAALLLVALITGLAVWRHTSTQRPTTVPWTPPAWSPATDPEGVFTAPPGAVVMPGDPSVATHHSVRIADVAVVDGGFVAVGTNMPDGESTATWWTSADGDAWSDHLLTTSAWQGFEPIEIAVWGDAILVTGWRQTPPTGDSVVALVRSDDGGTSWSDVALTAVADDVGRPMSAGSVSVVGDRLFLVGRAGHSYRTWVWSTTDGGRWDRSQVGDNGATAGAPVQAGSGYLVAGQDQHHRAAAWYSADGVTWQRTDLTDTPTNPTDWGVVESVASGPAGLVAVGWSGDPNFGFGVVDGELTVESRGRTPRWWWSADGRSWTPVGVVIRHSSIFGGWSPGVVASEDGYVIAESVVTGTRQQTVVLASPDGRSWAPSATLDGSINALSPGTGDVTWIAAGQGAFDYVDGSLDSPEPQPFDSGRVWLGS